MTHSVRIALLLAFAATSVASQAPAGFDFSIRNIMRGPELYGREPYTRIFNLFQRNLGPSRTARASPGGGQP